MREPVVEKLTLKPRIVALQVAGFLVGLALLAWCIRQALQTGDFSRLRDATAAQIAILIGCTLVSMIANGAIFWVLIRPVERISFWEINYVNGVVNLLNYAPVRLGLLTRVVHHRKIDGMSFVHLTAWYAAIAILMALTFGSLIGATVLRPRVDVWWLVIFAAFVTIGAAIIVWISAHHVLTKYLRGAHRMLSHPAQVAFGVALRLVDTAAYAGRLYAAFAILGVTLEFQDIVYLALISMVASLAPAGTLGFREWAVAFFAPLLTRADLHQIQWQAVLVDRAAEAVIIIPIGILCLVWMIHVWRTRAPRQR